MPRILKRDAKGRIMKVAKGKTARKSPAKKRRSPRKIGPRLEGGGFYSDGLIGPRMANNAFYSDGRRKPKRSTSVKRGRIKKAGKGYRRNIGPQTADGHFYSKKARGGFKRASAARKARKGSKSSKSYATKSYARKLKPVPTHLKSASYKRVAKSGNVYAVTTKFLGYDPKKDKRKKARKSRGKR